MNKKYIIVLSILGVLFGVSLLVGISYAYYIVNVSQTNKNIVKSSCLNLSISNEENVIRLEKQIPIMNEEGKKLTPYTFTINNTCNSMMGYSLNLEELEGSTLASKYIMTMVNDKDYVNMASLSSTDNYYSNSLESRVLATGSLGPNASINYSLRLWMDEATPMTTEAMNKSFRSKVVVVATPAKTVDFDYTGTEQVFVVPVSGTYKIETWGAQGGLGGFGGYSNGIIKVNDSDTLYISVGGTGKSGNRYFTESSYRGLGGWNGGGDGGLGQYYKDNTYWPSGYGGGGATSIQNVLIEDGQLKRYENNIDNVIIVAGGGGGTCHNGGSAGHGGGFSGTKSKPVTNDSISYGGNSIPGTQISGYAFGQGQTAADKTTCGAYGCEANGGSGGGFYGGFANMTEGYGSDDGGSGGSGYIGNHLLTNKVMYCYSCEESNEESTKTVSTTCAEETPTSNCAKIGNGYARITYIG